MNRVVAVGLLAQLMAALAFVSFVALRSREALPGPQKAPIFFTMSGEPGGILTLGLTRATAVAQGRGSEWGWEMMHPMWGLWGFWGFGMLLVMFVFWALVIVGLVVGIRWLVRQGRPPASDGALEILRQRYARGEIDREEFEARRRDLDR
jgi:putative membrane protein